MPDLYFYRDPLEVQEKEEAEGHVQEQAWAPTHEPKDEVGLDAMYYRFAHTIQITP